MLTAAALGALLVGGCSTSAADDADQVRELRQQFMVDLRAYYGRMATCLSDRGIAMEVNERGDGIRPPPGRGSSSLDRAAFRESYELCEEQEGAHPPMPPPPPEEDVLVYYDRQLETVACLEDLGHHPDPPPSREVYVETYLASFSGGGAPWSPYDGLVPDAMFDGMAACPPPDVDEVHVDEVHMDKTSGSGS